MLVSVQYSCNKDSQEDIDQGLIEDYVNSNSINASKHSTGLWYEIIKSGNSTMPVATSKVSVDYEGYFLDGNQFDAGNDIEFFLSQVIEGWQIGIPLIGEGGEILLIIPSHLAYGDNQVSGIPNNSVLAFEVKLHTVSK